MAVRSRSVRAVIGIVGLILCLPAALPGQEPPPPPAEAAAEELPPEPQGVEVMARGPVHEAFATPAADPVPTKPVPKQPPKPIEELPPDEKPEGTVVWIGGYWGWDDERNDFLWVSGVWRTLPPGKRWVAGYWKQGRDGWQWVPGFWTADKEGNAQELTYLPQPPATPDVAPPGQPPTADSFYVPGHWVWNGSGYAWRAGYWARVQPGYVWVPAHYRWTPSGYVFIGGYWDLAVARRGVLYAPVIVDPAVVTATFVYTPRYVVRETVVVDSLFIRPACCHYYFGDYYGVTYRDLGFESAIVYSRRRYDPLIVYERYEHRHVPDWDRVQFGIYLARYEGRAPLPPRTLAQQKIVVKKNVTNVNVTNINQTVVNNTTNVANAEKSAEVLVPASKHAAAKGVKTVPLDSSTRGAAKEQAEILKQVAAERKQAEVAAPAGAPAQPRTATLNVPKPKPVEARPPVASTPPARPAAKPETPAAATRPPAAERPAPEKPTAAQPPPRGSATGTPLTSPPAASRQPASNDKPPAARPPAANPPPAKPPDARPGSDPPPAAAKPPPGKPAPAPPSSSAPSRRPPEKEKEKEKKKEKN